MFTILPVSLSCELVSVQMITAKSFRMNTRTIYTFGNRRQQTTCRCFFLALLEHWCNARSISENSRNDYASTSRIRSVRGLGSRRAVIPNKHDVRWSDAYYWHCIAFDKMRHTYDCKHCIQEQETNLCTMLFRMIIHMQPSILRLDWVSLDTLTNFDTQIKGVGTNGK